jgi:hypothetical protein
MLITCETFVAIIHARYIRTRWYQYIFVVGRSLPQLANNAVTCHAIAMRNELNQPPGSKDMYAPSKICAKIPCRMYSCYRSCIRSRCLRSFASLKTFLPSS